MPGAAVKVGFSDGKAALQDLSVLVGEHEPCIQAGAAKVRKERDAIPPVGHLRDPIWSVTQHRHTGMSHRKATEMVRGAGAPDI